MKRKYIHSHFLISLISLTGILFFSGCHEEDPVPLSNNSAIAGYARVDWTNNSGIEVTAIGPYGNQKATTNNEGFFMFTGLGNGTYDLEYQKEDYGTYKQFGFQLFGSDTVSAGNINLFEITRNVSIPLLGKVKDSQLLPIIPSDAIAITTTYNNELPPARFFIAYDDQVDCHNFGFTLVSYETNAAGESGKLYTLNSFSSLRIQHGRKVYMVAYVCQQGDSGYLDPHKDEIVYPSLIESTKSNIVEFINP